MAYFSLSACQMNVTIDTGALGLSSGGPGSLFQINASMLNAADCIAIIVVVPLLDGFFYPNITKCLGRRIKSTEKYVDACTHETTDNSSLLVVPCHGIRVGAGVRVGTSSSPSHHCTCAGHT